MAAVAAGDTFGSVSTNTWSYFWSLGSPPHTTWSLNGIYTETFKLHTVYFVKVATELPVGI